MALVVAAFGEMESCQREQMAHVRGLHCAVFKIAQEHRWINPASNTAQLQPPTEGGFQFKFSYAGENVVQIDYLIDPWLPRATVIGCYGRGEAGKSSWTAQACAIVSNQVSTLWISSEENPSHIRQRHLSCGGQVNTLAVLEAVPTKIDAAMNQRHLLTH